MLETFEADFTGITIETEFMTVHILKYGDGAKMSIYGITAETLEYKFDNPGSLQQAEQMLKSIYAAYKRLYLMIKDAYPEKEAHNVRIKTVFKDGLWDKAMEMRENVPNEPKTEEPQETEEKDATE